MEDRSQDSSNGGTQRRGSHRGQRNMPFGQQFRHRGRDFNGRYSGGCSVEDSVDYSEHAASHGGNAYGRGRGGGSGRWRGIPKRGGRFPQPIFYDVQPRQSQSPRNTYQDHFGQAASEGTRGTRHGRARGNSHFKQTHKERRPNGTSERGSAYQRLSLGPDPFVWETVRDNALWASYLPETKEDVLDRLLKNPNWPPEFRDSPPSTLDVLCLVASEPASFPEVVCQSIPLPTMAAKRLLAHPSCHPNWRGKPPPLFQLRLRDGTEEVVVRSEPRAPRCQTDAIASKKPSRQSQGDRNRKKVVPVLDATDEAWNYGGLDNQRESMSVALISGTYECMICCEVIRFAQSIWSCKGCYHVFHFRCAERWARSSTLQEGDSGQPQRETLHWRCPCCQKEYHGKVQSFCLCGRMRDPPFDRREDPHSCGGLCSRQREFCSHPCPLPCHPGPCDPCEAHVRVSCRCQNSPLQPMLCKNSYEIRCSEPCGKKLKCGHHTCSIVCQAVGTACESCTKTREVSCDCGKSVETVVCGEVGPSFTWKCKTFCGKKLNCRNHECEVVCHSGECSTCSRDPTVVTHCPCGRTPLENARKSCLDPIPTCGKSPCGKELACGPPGSRHTCEKECHLPPCPPCQKSTQVVCRCGQMMSVLCSKYLKSEEILCGKRCKKLLSCRRHQCTERCCIDLDHQCPRKCGKALPCGLHRCELDCHSGNCYPCLQSSFEELTCHCGGEIIHPPVPCGTKPPRCERPCIREHPCDHKVSHHCHSDTECPPCTVLRDVMCFGGHRMRKNVPCYLDSMSCGAPCDKILPCGDHKCRETCHRGECPPCKQICLVLRVMCPHPCGAPCHKGQPCPPNRPCEVKVLQQCICKNVKKFVICKQYSVEVRHRAAAMASKKNSTGSQAGVDVQKAAYEEGLVLPCNEECGIIQRNRRLALGLQIRNPELSGKPGPPPYSDFVLEMARREPDFVDEIHAALSALVQRATEATGKSRVHEFPAMNRNKRRFIHEYSEHFGCESHAVDPEPNRSVVATAFKEKCYLPSVSVLGVVRKGQRQRTIPPPPAVGNRREVSESFAARFRSSTGSGKGVQSSASSAAPKIDYFNLED